MALVTITIDEVTHGLIRFAAKISGLSEDEVVRRAVLAYAPPERDPATDPWVPVAVYAKYLRQRTDAMFVRATHRLTITTGTLSGTSYDSPSAASRAVVHALNPKRASGHSDGWRFWRVSATGEPLDVLR